MNRAFSQDIFLGLGSNVGNRREYLKTAVIQIQSFATIIRCSSVYETEPVGYEAQDLFFNAVVRIGTDLSPKKLMNRLLFIEAESGRVRNERYAPRTLDIDIIFYGQQIIRENGLDIPHMEFVNRRFVLAPLAEIAPEWICPVNQKTIAKLLEICPDKKRVTRLTDIQINAESNDRVILNQAFGEVHS